jgi:hypothetical protein
MNRHHAFHSETELSNELHPILMCPPVPTHVRSVPYELCTKESFVCVTSLN